MKAPYSSRNNASFAIKFAACLTRDGFKQAFGDQVDRLGEGKGKYSGLTTSKNLAMVAFTDDGSCVKYINIFARHQPAPKTAITESHSVKGHPSAVVTRVGTEPRGL